ncbi:MAG: DUF5998 family protein [Nocardioidaceae bacterium]
MVDTTQTNQAASLRAEIERVGYHPAEVAEAVEAALASEAVTSFVIHHEPTFDRDELRRHATVLALTPTRLIFTHTDEHPPDDMLPEPYTSTTTEVVPLRRVESVSTTRLVPSASSRPAGPAERLVSEVVVTIGWGAMSRVDLEPTDCGDPECTADHGLSGLLSAEDFSLRVSATADGENAVTQLLGFARALSAATAGP